jgi:hypothetical protein
VKIFLAKLVDMFESNPQCALIIVTKTGDWNMNNLIFSGSSIARIVGSYHAESAGSAAAQGVF